MGIPRQRQTTQSFLELFVVVFPSPGFDNDLGLAQAGELVFVQSLIPEAAFERFDVSILIGLA